MFVSKLTCIIFISLNLCFIMSYLSTSKTNEMVELSNKLTTTLESPTKKQCRAIRGKWKRGRCIGGKKKPRRHKKKKPGLAKRLKKKAKKVLNNVLNKLRGKKKKPRRPKHRRPNRRSNKRKPKRNSRRPHKKPKSRRRPHKKPKSRFWFLMRSY